MEPKRGRPKTENPKIADIKVRLDKRTADRLDAYCEQKKVRRAEAIRMAIENLLKK